MWTADYEEKKFVAKSENITVGMLLDLWVEEELKPGNLSNGTVMSLSLIHIYIIQINNLNKSFGSVNAVQNLSFRVKKGELFAFLGRCV